MIPLKVRKKSKILLAEIAKTKEALQHKVFGELPSPQSGPQSQFLDSDADITLYGGAAGSGKSLGLLLDFAKPEYLANPEYGAVIFRRTYPQIRNEGGLWDESAKLYSVIGAIAKESNLEWQFPSGATIRFAHLQHDKNIYDWQGSQLVRSGYDELTHFSRKSFFYLLSRNRSTCGIKPQIRATCNPDADSWVAELVGWWINEQGFPIPERSGVLRWFVNLNNDLIWADSSEELRNQFPDIAPKSFTFIAAKITDNPILLEKDPGYLANLQALHPVDQARLLDGNWKVKVEAGKVFNRTWFEVVDSVPDTGITVRFWDLAATAADLKKDSFYTAGVKMRFWQGIWYVLDAIAERVSPAQGDELMLSTAQQDGRGVRVRWELEGGSAGKRDEEHLHKLLRGFDAAAVRPQGDKVTRAKPFATEAKAGNVKLLRGIWNPQYINALHGFDGMPKPLINDLTDASSGGYAELTPVIRRGAVGSGSWVSRG